LFKIKKNKGLRGDVLEYVAQARPQFDTEIGQKDHFRMETNSKSHAECAMSFLEKARENRRHFLQPFKHRVEALQQIVSDAESEVWDKRKADQEISDIVLLLFKIEPSHVEEDWISAIIQGWAQDFKKADELEAAFVSQGSSGSIQEQQTLEAKWGKFRFKIYQYLEEGLTFTDAIKRYLGKNPGHDFSYLWKRFYNEQGMPVLPWPYDGRDIRKETDGTHRMTGKGTAYFTMKNEEVVSKKRNP
jgi:hypothetical protein